MGGRSRAPAPAAHPPPGAACARRWELRLHARCSEAARAAAHTVVLVHNRLQRSGRQERVPCAPLEVYLHVLTFLPDDADAHDEHWGRAMSATASLRVRADVAPPVRFAPDVRAPDPKRQMAALKCAVRQRTEEAAKHKQFLDGTRGKTASALQREADLSNKLRRAERTVGELTASVAVAAKQAEGAGLEAAEATAAADAATQKAGACEAAHLAQVRKARRDLQRQSQQHALETRDLRRKVKASTRSQEGAEAVTEARRLQLEVERGRRLDAEQSARGCKLQVAAVVKVGSAAAVQSKTQSAALHRLARKTTREKELSDAALAKAADVAGVATEQRAEAQRQQRAAATLVRTLSTENRALQQRCEDLQGFADSAGAEAAAEAQQCTRYQRLYGKERKRRYRQGPAPGAQPAAPAAEAAEPDLGAAVRKLEADVAGLTGDLDQANELIAKLSTVTLTEGGYKGKHTRCQPHAPARRARSFGFSAFKCTTWLKQQAGRGWCSGQAGSWACAKHNTGC